MNEGFGELRSGETTSVSSCPCCPKSFAEHCSKGRVDKETKRRTAGSQGHCQNRCQNRCVDPELRTLPTTWMEEIESMTAVLKEIDRISKFWD